MIAPNIYFRQSAKDDKIKNFEPGTRAAWLDWSENDWSEGTIRQKVRLARKAIYFVPDEGAGTIRQKYDSSENEIHNSSDESYF